MASAEWKTGDTYALRGQTYQIMGYVVHDGARGPIPLLEMKTMCPDCGDMFRVKATKTSLKLGHVTRRCSSCPRPGARVSP